MGATTSLLILRQLEDKKVCLDFYINFLQEVGIWDRVRKTLRNGKVCLEMFFMKMSRLYSNKRHGAHINYTVCN